MRGSAARPHPAPRATFSRKREEEWKGGSGRPFCLAARRGHERNDGYIDKFVGDGLMAIFGVGGQPDAPIRSVNAALQTLAAVDRMKPFFASMYGIDFDIRIGLHWGEASSARSARLDTND